MRGFYKRMQDLDDVNDVNEHHEFVIIPDDEGREQGSEDEDDDDEVTERCCSHCDYCETRVWAEDEWQCISCGKHNSERTPLAFVYRATDLHAVLYRYEEIQRYRDTGLTISLTPAGERVVGSNEGAMSDEVLEQR